MKLKEIQNLGTSYRHTDKKGTCDGSESCFGVKSRNVAMISRAKSNFPNNAFSETRTIDSECFRHICNEISFSETIENYTGEIQVNNLDYVEVSGLETAKGMTTTNAKVRNITIKIVLYAPVMLHNLLFSSQASKTGYNTVIKNDNQSKDGGIFKMINEQSESID